MRKNAKIMGNRYVAERKSRSRRAAGGWTWFFWHRSEKVAVASSLGARITSQTESTWVRRGDGKSTVRAVNWLWGNYHYGAAQQSYASQVPGQVQSQVLGGKLGGKSGARMRSNQLVLASKP